jgi:hypothetical protein
LNSSTRINTYLVLEVALDQYLHNDSYAWQYSNDSTFLLIVKLPMYLKLPTTWSSKFWYPSIIGSFKVSQQVFWYPNGTRAITRWTNHLDSASVILGLHMRYIIIDNLMNKSLSFRTILTKWPLLRQVYQVWCLILLVLSLDCLLVLSFFLMYLSSATLKHLLHCPKVLEFSVKTGLSGLPNRTIWCWKTCFVVSSFG